MQNKCFNFKQFSIYGGNSGMPVSTDGVLLGAWCDLAEKTHVLDIGTGTGLLTLMVAQRYPDLQLSAIDIDSYAVDSASLNIERSPWSTRISLLQADVLDHHFDSKFDAIICNPPYFNSGEQAQQAQRATARHTDSLNHLALIRRCDELTTEHASATFILPTPEGEAFIELALQHGWFLAKRLDVKTTERKAATRIVFELSKDQRQVELQQLTINANNGYSEAFIALTKDFYLKM